MSSPMDPATGHVAMSRLRSASGVLIMQPFDLEFYRQGPTLEPEICIECNRMRLDERRQNASIQELFASDTTKSERTMQSQKDRGNQQNYRKQETL